MRPSWRTATSGRGGPMRRRGSASARGRATSSRSSGGRPSGDWRGGRRLGRPPAGRARPVAAEEAAKWERRRLQALEDGWQTCRALRARLERCSPPPESPGRRRARAGRGGAGGPPRRRRDARGAGDGRVASRRGGMTDGGAAVEADRRAGVGAAGEALPPPGRIDPLTATDEEIKAYLARHPRLGRPPPR